MREDTLREQLSDIGAIGNALKLRFALFKHIRQTPNADKSALLHEIDVKLAEARQLMKESTSPSMEEMRFKRVRELEDQRFQLLSEINGDNLSQYTLETALKNH
jgi:hypothetical protein